MTFRIQSKKLFFFFCYTSEKTDDLFLGEKQGTANSHTKYLRRQAEATLLHSALAILPSFPPYISAHPFLTTTQWPRHRWSWVSSGHSGPQTLLRLEVSIILPEH